MKNLSFIILIFIIVLLIGGFVYSNVQSNSQVIINNPDIVGGEVQKVVLSMKDYNYYPQTLTVKENQPVELTLDSSVQGCFRSFSIKEFGVNKYAKTPDEKIIFTPTSKGTFSFSCSMGMGKGKLVVE